MDSPSLIRFVIASLTVLALLGGLAWALKYMASRGWCASPRLQNKRLKVVESLALDTRRRLVVVKCDDAEHLLLLSPQNDSVVAANIRLPLPPSPTAPAKSP